MKMLTVRTNLGRMNAYVMLVILEMEKDAKVIHDGVFNFFFYILLHVCPPIRRKLSKC